VSPADAEEGHVEQQGQPDPDPLLTAASGLGDLLLGEEDVDDALEAAVDVVRQVVSGDPMASLTVRPGHGGGPTTRVATDPLARELDEWQYEHGEGPCVTAHEDVVVCAVGDLRRSAPVPDFAEVALDAGVHGVASYPLLVREDVSIGSLNLFYRAAGVIDDAVADTGSRLAKTIAPTLANFLTYQGAVELTDQLQEALEGRAVIERAKGLLMARLDIDGEAAFQLLSTQSQQQNERVRDVAAGLLKGHGDQGDDAG
jgi:hypothetical protein